MAEVCVILPTYQGARYVEASVRSVLAQTGCDFELVVCDDGSTDDTLRIVQRLADARTRVERNEHNRGLFPTLNRLIRSTTAPLIRLWSQDDVMLPGCLAREVAFGRAHPDLAMWWCAVETIDAEGRVVEAPKPDETPERVDPVLAARIMVRHGSITGNIANVTLRRSAVERCGLFREDMMVSGDFEMWVRLSESSPIGRLATPGVRLRSHAGQFSRDPSSALRFMRENQEIYARLFARLPPGELAEALHHKATVLDPMVVHHAVRCLVRGEPHLAREVLSTLGPWPVVARAAFHWSSGFPLRLARRLRGTGRSGVAPA